MKRNLYCLIVAFLISLTITAQETSPKDSTETIKFSSASLSSGNGPLSCGLFFEGNFIVKERDILNISLGERDMYLLYLKSFNKNNNLLFGPSLEYYHNVPSLGLMAITTPLPGKFSISTMTWVGISAGNPDEKIELLNWRFLYFWQSATFAHKNLSLTLAGLYFDRWGKLFDVKYTQPITKEFSLFSSAGYSFYGNGCALLKLGVTYQPKK